MSNNKYDPVLISLIKKNTMPNILAEEICSVQPMYSPHSTEEWPYQADILGKIKYKDIGEVKDWCRETLNEDEWVATVQFFAFKTEEAYAWFKMRWL